MIEEDSENKTEQTSIFSFGENTLSSMKETITTIREYEFTEPLRKCNICGVLLPLSEFHRRKSTERGKIKKYYRECKKCASRKQAQYKKDHPEETKEKSRRYQERYYERNAETIRERARKYQEKYSERIKEMAFLTKSSSCYHSGYLNGTGICLLCGESHSLLLENHHLYPDSELVISLCANCHKKYRAGSNRELHMITILGAIEKTPYLWKHIKISKNVEMFNLEDATIVETISGFDGKQIEVVRSK